MSAFSRLPSARIAAILARALDESPPNEAEITDLFEARGGDFAAVCEALGLELPTTVGTVARNGAICLGQPGYDKNETAGVIALALGPDWWLLTGTADPEALLADVRAQHHMSLVDVSAQRTKLEVYRSAGTLTGGSLLAIEDNR